MAHTPELLRTLKDTADLLEHPEIVSYMVYGSRSRPLSASWVRIPDAVFIQNDEGTRRATGYYTYVAVPTPLQAVQIASYDLTFASGDAQEERKHAFLKHELEKLIRAEVAQKEAMVHIRAIAEIAQTAGSAEGWQAIIMEGECLLMQMQSWRQDLERSL